MQDFWTINSIKLTPGHIAHRFSPGHQWIYAIWNPTLQVEVFCCEIWRPDVLPWSNDGCQMELTLRWIEKDCTILFIAQANKWYLFHFASKSWLKQSIARILLRGLWPFLGNAFCDQEMCPRMWEAQNSRTLQLLLDFRDLPNPSNLQSTGCSWSKNPPWILEVGVLLVEEILHELIGSLYQYLQGFLHPRWCRISSINSMMQGPSFWGIQISRSFSVVLQTSENWK